MRRLLLVGPTSWDRDAAADPARAGGFRFETVEARGLNVPDSPGALDLLRPLDVLRLADREIRRRSSDPPDGVVGTDEHLACVVAALIARGLGRPGADPAPMLRIQHKATCRARQREILPDAVPWFREFDPEDPPSLAFPCFVKPVRGTFSVMSAPVRSAAELESFCRVPPGWRAAARRLLAPWQRLADRLADGVRADRFLAEPILPGAPVTVEGFVHEGRAEAIGVVDAHYYPGTWSFERFEYPSRLPAERQKLLERMACRLAEGLGLDGTMFNIEFMLDDAGRPWVLEVNPRMAYQFADLHEKVDGFHTYDLQFELACGERPVVRQGHGPWRFAGSFCLRRFDDPVLVAHPPGDDVRRAEAERPGLRVHLYGRPGERFAERRVHPSARYALIHAGADSRESLREAVERARSRLRFEFHTDAPPRTGPFRPDAGPFLASAVSGVSR